MKYFDYFDEYVNEAKNAIKSRKALKSDILDIEDTGVTIKEMPEDRKMIVKTDNIDLATRIHKFILTNKREYGIKSAETSDINDVKIVFKSAKEIKKEEKETAQKIKDKEEERDAMNDMGDLGIEDEIADVPAEKKSDEEELDDIMKEKK